jgi:hypothetical protein
MRIVNAAWTVVVGLGLAACGDSGSTSGSGGGGTGGGGTGGGTGGTTTASTGGGGTGGSSPVMPPVMESASPLEGALHVMWTNVTMDCDTIELDRNKDGGAFATEYTLAGAATSQHDTGASAPGTYCYKARCTRGADVSADSNEVCGTP